MSRVMRPAALALAAIVVAACGDGAPDATPEPAPVEPPAQLADLLGAWRPKSLPLAPETLLLADRTCQATGPQAGAFELPLANYRLAVADARGRGEIWLVYTGPGGRIADCRLTLAPNGGMTADGFGSGNGDAAAAPFELVIHFISASGGPDPAPDQTGVVGAAGPGIDRVRAIVPNGPVTEASVGRGVFAAWWPRSITRMKIEGLDAFGAIVAETDG